MIALVKEQKILACLTALLLIALVGLYNYNNKVEFSPFNNATSTPSTPVPVPAAIPASRGESGLYTLSFTRSDDLKKPIINIKLRNERTVEFKRISPTSYQLTIPSAHVSAPIFLLPQIAPEGFEPFAKVILSELTGNDEPNHIVVADSSSITALIFAIPL